MIGVALVTVPQAAAQSYPAKPVTFVVPFPAGGPVELIARIIGTPLGDRLGQPVLVEARPGASATIGAAYVAKGDASGHTLLFTATTHAVVPATMADVPYDAVKDFAPVALIGKMPMIVVTNNNIPANTLAEFSKHAQSRPGKLNYGTGSPGGTAHLVTAMYLQRAGLSMVDIPYKGSAPAVVDLIAGRVDLYFDVPGIVLSHVREGRLKALAVTTAARLPAIANVPTVAESGLPGFDASIWMGILSVMLKP